MSTSNPRRVLVVEDEYFLADDLRRALENEGVSVVGPVSSVSDALAMIDDAPVDCAILDINLNGRMVYPLARTLRERGVPFMFVTGYGEAPEEEGWADVDLIQKPFQEQAVLDGIERLMQVRATR